MGDYKGDQVIVSTKNKSIKKAVFPVAGIGSRLLPATKAVPKEMLTVVDRPLIQYAVEEAYSAGVRQMIFVLCQAKTVIADHFKKEYPFEQELLTQCKKELIATVKAVSPQDMECIYVRQNQALGLGHAILCAEPIVGAEPFAVILADDLIQSPRSVLKQLLDVYEQYSCSIIAINDVPETKVSAYGIVEGDLIDTDLYNVRHLIEKPSPGETASTTAIVGRYILTASIFKCIRELPYEEGKEIQLTHALASLLKTEPIYAYQYKGSRYDCGSLLGFLQANVALGKYHTKVGQEFSNWLENNSK